jgi:hypothetical protein
MRPRLLFSAPALTGGDHPHRLISTHAAHGSGGVHRPQDNATTPQQKFCRLSDIPIAALFRFAVEDLKAYYCEATTAQPGQNAVDSQMLSDWFWRETTAGQVLFAVQEVRLHSEVPGMQVVAASFLIPRARSAESPFAKA